MTYPDGIDALVNVNADQTLAAGGHAARHNSTNTALAEVRDFLASGSANTVLTAGSVVPTWDLVDPVSIANGSAGYVLTAGSAVPTWAPGGKILQVVSTTKSDTFTTNSTSFVDVTGLSATITPTATSSNILIFVTLGALNQDDGAAAARINLVRSSTNILQPSSGTFPASLHFYSANQFQPSNGSMSVLDSPSTTSAVTYKVQATVTAGNMSINRRLFDTNLNAPSTITAMEISA
jgi:hypothetical protein